MHTEIVEFSSWIRETSPETIVKTFDEILHSCNFIVLNFMEHTFKPHGYTAVWLLSESHFAIHTFPEKQKCYIQLSSCNEEKHAKFIDRVNAIEWK